MLIDLSDRVAIVTGAARNIGAAVARQLAGCGAKVVIADIDSVNGKSVAESIINQGGNAYFYKVDLNEEEQIRDMVATTLKVYNGLDILINNAHYEVIGSVLDITADDWDRSFAVLLRAMFLTSKYAIPHMIESGGGSIVNFSSLYGKNPISNYVTYTTAKAAVIQLSRQMAIDYGRYNIRVNTLIPGGISANPIDNDEAAKIFPLRRRGQSKEIAYVVCFLVSDYATLINGAEIVVDVGEGLPHMAEVHKRIKELIKDGELDIERL